MKSEFVDGLGDAYPIIKMCEWLSVSTSGFHEWRFRPVSTTMRRCEELKTLIMKTFTDSDETYGYRRVHAELVRWGTQAGPELVRALMRELNLVPCQPKPCQPKPCQPKP